MSVVPVGPLQHRSGYCDGFAGLIDIGVVGQLALPARIDPVGIAVIGHGDIVCRDRGIPCAVVRNLLQCAVSVAPPGVAAHAVKMSFRQRIASLQCEPPPGVVST